MAPVSGGTSGSQNYGSSNSVSGSSPTDPGTFNAINARLMAQYGTGQLPTGPNYWNQALGLVGRGSKPISTAPIWDPGQIQAQVNQTNANNWSQAGGQERQLAGTLGGRGFGGNSPLYQALSTNLGAQTRNTNTQAENNLRWTAAQGNAQQVLAEQQAESQRQQGLSGLATGLYGTDVGATLGQQNAILQALSGLNQPRAWGRSSSTQRGASASAQGSYDPSAAQNFNAALDTPGVASY